MLIPMAVAIISYYRTAGQPVDVYKAKTLEIADTNGKIYTFSSEKDEEGMIALFSGINNNMTSISSLPEPLRTAPFFKVTFNINGTESVYKYYFSPVSDSYCEDSAGKAYKIKQENAALFVATKYASSLYESANPPLLTTAGGEAVLPGSIFWSFRTSDGTFTDMMGIPTAQAQQSFDMDGSFLLDFDIQPDYVNAKVYDGDNLIFNDLYKNLAGSISITDNTTYKIELEAFWYEDAQRDYRGQATYTVYANVTAPAVFYLGRTKTDRGDVVAISAKNVTDETKIGFTSEPALTFGGKEIVPVFYRTGNVSNALVPIPYDTTVDTYTFTLTYGAITQTMVLEVGAKTFKTGYTSEATQLEVNTFRSEAALKEFADLITSLSSQSAPKCSGTENSLFRSSIFYIIWASGIPGQ